MIPKSLRSILIVLLILSMLMAFTPRENAYALKTDSGVSNLPLLSTFISQVRNGQAGEVRELYIPEILAATVVHQPREDNNFVSSEPNSVTLFGPSSQLGSTGLLAHNYLAGANFFLAQKDQIFYLIYGDGQISMWVVKEILQYQALNPTSKFSNFIDLKNNASLTTAEAFSKVYDRPGQVILQTCIAMDHNASWGRLFVIAQPFIFKTPVNLQASTREKL